MRVCWGGGSAGGDAGGLTCCLLSPPPSLRPSFPALLRPPLLYVLCPSSRYSFFSPSFICHLPSPFSFSSVSILPSVSPSYSSFISSCPSTLSAFFCLLFLPSLQPFLLSLPPLSSSFCPFVDLYIIHFSFLFFFHLSFP